MESVSGRVKVGEPRYNAARLGQRVEEIKDLEKNGSSGEIVRIVSSSLATSEKFGCKICHAKIPR